MAKPQISRFSDIESSSKSVMYHGSLTFKGISNVFSQMADQTPVVIYVKYCNTNLYYIFIMKNYPYYMAKSLFYNCIAC